MKINDKNMISEISKHLPGSTRKETEQIGTKQLAHEKKAQGPEQRGQDAIVDFSPELQTAQTIKDIIASEPDVREDRVAELKAKIESGRYRVDHKAVARNLVDSYLDETFKR